MLWMYYIDLCILSRFSGRRQPLICYIKFIADCLLACIIKMFMHNLYLFRKCAKSNLHQHILKTIKSNLYTPDLIHIIYDVRQQNSQMFYNKFLINTSYVCQLHTIAKCWKYHLIKFWKWNISDNFWWFV